ncbi:hypothetical protein V1514DRAFT_194182 [Lipomyces japonicus]|uniref:uncharacterized protein n=1 Tax=Lipomyces japonicus TaxID=56871 RepID=UPI0034CF699E
MSFHGPVYLRNPQHFQDNDHSFDYISTLDMRYFISIHHPAYSPPSDLLFKLYSSDHRMGGIHFGLVMDACTIIANNRRDGWLSTDRNGENRVNGDLDQVLALGNYWYHLPRENGKIPKWPVVTCFKDWEFPSSLPPSWIRVPNAQKPLFSFAPSEIISSIHTRDVYCRITGHNTATDVAHIIPRAEKDWFENNGMRYWNWEPSLLEKSLLDDQTNLMLLRSDVHQAFDDKYFVLYPKDSAGFYVHMLHYTTDLGVLYHNSKTHPLLNCQPEFLYARFAWSLFPLITGFLGTSVEKEVISVAEGGHRSIITARKIETKRRYSQKSSQGTAMSEARSEGNAQVGWITRKPKLQLRGNNQENVNLSDSEETRLAKMREAELEKQRPKGFVPFKGDPFEGKPDPITVFERLGYDVVDDRDMG